METENSEKKINKKRESKKAGLSKKLDIETAKLLEGIREKINKKSYGRKIREASIIAHAVKLITPEDIQKLQESTLTEKDRLLMAHEDWCKENGKITIDQFIGKLIRGEIRTQKEAS